MDAHMRFATATKQEIEAADSALDQIGNLLDDVENEGATISAAREAFVKAQLAIADLRTKLQHVSADELESHEEEEEDEEEEEESE